MQELNPIKLERPQKRASRAHSKAFKAKLVARAEAGNISVAQLAMDNMINTNQLRKWMNESHRVATTGTKMVPVSVVPEVSNHTTVAIELTINACTLKIHHSWDPVAVAKLVKALR